MEDPQKIKDIVAICPQSFPASGSFPVSLLFTSGGQSIGASVSATLLPIAFPRQEYWSGLLFPSPGDLHDPVIELGSPALQADSLDKQRIPKMAVL